MVTDLGMKIGQYWADRNGDQSLILGFLDSLSTDYSVRVRDSHGDTHTHALDGRFCDTPGSGFDLIQLVKDVPCSGT